MTDCPRGEVYTGALASTWRRSAGGAALSVLVVLAVACSDEPNRADDETASSASREGTSTTTGSASDAREQEVIDGYLAAEDAFVEAASGPDPEYALEKTYTGPMLNQTRAIVEGLAADGLVVTFPSDSQSSKTVTDVEFRSDDVAIVSACVVDDGMRVDQETEDVVVGGEGPVTAWVDAAMELHDGTWKMAERQMTERKAGVACDTGA